MIGYIIDIEANGLYPTIKEVWTIKIKELQKDRWLTLHPYLMNVEDVKQQILDFVFSQYEIPYIITQNGLGYDLWLLWMKYGMEFQLGPDLWCGREVIIFDILYGSQFLLPDRVDGHSLKSWGVRHGDHKIDYYNLLIDKEILPKGSLKGSEFSFWTPDMDIYCEQDCVITETTFIQEYKEFQEQNTLRQFQNGQKNFWLMNAQSFTGFKFDQPLGEKLKNKIEGMIQQLKNEVEPLLPQRGLKKTEQSNYIFPAKIYNQDGSFSANMKKFIIKHNAELIDDKIKIYNKTYDLIPKQLLDIKFPISLEDQNELKDFFLSQNWKPTLFNYKTDPKTGRKLRDSNKQLIKTTPKIQENQKICPNLLELEGDIAKKVVKFLSLRNRAGVLNGWREDPRLKWDGRISAGASGIASTHRQKHVKVVNVPKADPTVLLGNEFRSLWTVEEGFKLVSCDAAALEARIQSHYLALIGDKEAADELINGDVHSKNAKAFFPEETKNFDIKSSTFDKDDKEFKPYRSVSKNGYYAIIYGCSYKKLATTLRKKEEEGKIALENFWNANPGLKQLKETLTNFWIEKGYRKYIIGIDGRRLYSRSEHSLINLLFQNAGAIAMDTALILFHNKMGKLYIDELGRPYYKYKEGIVRRVVYVHDEWGSEVSIDIVEEIAKIKEQCIEEAGKILKLKVDLKGEAKIGMSWYETH